MSELTRLDWIREEHAKNTPTTPATNEDLGYLLHVIELLEKQIEAQILAHLDPDPPIACTCYYTIQDDCGTTIVASTDPHCQVHKKEPRR